MIVRSFNAILVAAVVTLALVGCDSQSPESDGPPAMLPPEVFAIDADMFETGANKMAAKEHFAAAALRVWSVTLILRANLLIPAAVTAAATQDAPTFVDGAWRWSSTSTVGSQTLGFTLIARPEGNGADWSMRISASQPIQGETYDDFELFAAETRRTPGGGVEGSWSLFYPDGGAPRNVLNAEFEYDEDADRKALTFRIPESADEHGGDAVRYAVLANQHQFLWEQVDPPVVHDVRWNAATLEGSIQATNFNDGAAACWGPDLENVACPD